MVQVIDLDMLDKVGSAKGVEELRVQLKQQVGSLLYATSAVSSIEDFQGILLSDMGKSFLVHKEEYMMWSSSSTEYATDDITFSLHAASEASNLLAANAAGAYQTVCMIDSASIHASWVCSRSHVANGHAV